MDPTGYSYQKAGRLHKRTSFLSLPGEVRNSIYALLLPKPGSTFCLGKQYDLKSYVFRSTPYDHTALFLACHQVRHEASSLFYPSNTFSISRPTQLTLYVRDLTPHTRDQLSHLSISVTLSLSSLSRRRRGRSLTATDFPPKGRNANAILPQNRDLKHLSKFTALTFLTISLNIEACDLQRYLAPSHVVFLEDLVPTSAEIRIEVGKCAHCLHWHDSTSNPMATADVEKNQQWWRWSSPPRSSQSQQPSEPSASREWVLTRTIGGIAVDTQPFPPINYDPKALDLAPKAVNGSPIHLKELLSQCHTCQTPLLPPSPFPAETTPRNHQSPPSPHPSPPSSSATTSTSGQRSYPQPQSVPFPTLLAPAPAQRHPRSRAQTCEVCALVSFCSKLCFAACVEHQHLCVPKPFG